MDVGVLDLDVAKKLFLVQKCDGDGRVLDREGKTVINGARDEQHSGQVITCDSRLLDQNRY